MARPRNVKKVCLAYSGGLDTSVILHWLKEHYDCEVVAYTADIGQEEELSGLPEKAKATGAVDCVIRDLREEFVRDFVFPAIRGNAIYEGTYLLGTALARPLIAKHQVEVALETGCDAVAHGATGQGQRPGPLRADVSRARARARRSSRRGGSGICARGPTASPTAEKHGIPISATLEKPYSIDRNLMHVSYEGGILEDPWRAPDEDMFLTTCSPEEAPGCVRRAGDRLRAGHAGLDRRRGVDAGGAAGASSTSWRAPTAWAASTWSRTASSA